jgi:ribosomal protein L37AE/L43A
MVIRQCPNCGIKNYSSKTFEEYWQCCKCGADISKSKEQSIYGGDKYDPMRGMRYQDTLRSTIRNAR